MLLPDEQYVLKWLSQYGALTSTQVVRLLRHKPPDIIDKILRGLKRQCLIAEISDPWVPLSCHRKICGEQYPH
jgi:hypothetical protein